MPGNPNHFGLCTLIARNCTSKSRSGALSGALVSSWEASGWFGEKTLQCNATVKGVGGSTLPPAVTFTSDSPPVRIVSLAAGLHQLTSVDRAALINVRCELAARCLACESPHLRIPAILMSNLEFPVKAWVGRSISRCTAQLGVCWERRQLLGRRSSPTHQITTTLKEHDF